MWARRAPIVAALLLSIVGTAVGAQGPSLEISVPPNAVRVGDPVQLRATARGGEGLLWGELHVEIEENGPWVLVDGPTELEGARPPVWELVLAPLEVGELPLPSIGAAVRDSEGEVFAVAAENPPAVNVASVLPEGEEAEAVGLRDPEGVHGFPWEWVVPVGLPLLAAACAAVWWGRRRRSGRLEARPAIEPLPELEALLGRLEARVGREPAESICDRLAVGLRHYLGRQSGEPAADMTSFELRLLARHLQWPDGVQRGVQDVMSVVDRVRFGKITQDESGLRRALAETRDWSKELDREMVSRRERERAALEEAAG